jgi:hypothetical protein
MVNNYKEILNMATTLIEIDKYRKKLCLNLDSFLIDKINISSKRDIEELH